MPTLTDNIASWEEQYLLPDVQLFNRDGIATEARQQESPEWDRCLDALLKAWVDASNDVDSQPNQSSIEAAIEWVAFLRKRYPTAPPTCIIPEPDGGLIVERRVSFTDGRECVCELTFYNDGRAERTDYLDGRVVQLAPIPQRPPF